MYRSGNLETSDFEPALVSDYLEDSSCLVWLDLPSPSVEQLAMLQEEFCLHPLAVEDASHPHQRPKLEHYDTHLFFVIYAVHWDGTTLHSSEVDVFLGQQFIITVRKDPSWPIEPIVERWDRGDGLAGHGVGFLLHGLMDGIVDNYLRVARVLSEELDRVEDEVLLGRLRGDVQERLVDLRRALTQFKRVVLPLAEAQDDLERQDLLILAEGIRPYFKDVRDHLMRVTDSIESMHGLLGTAFTLLLSVSSNRLNEIMKRVTSWAAIIGVATTIAGIYGMNYNLVFPPQDHPHSFWVAIGIMVVSTSVLWVYLKKKDWL